MKRALLSTLALLLAASSAFGQDQFVPSPQDPFATNNATIQSTNIEPTQNTIPAPAAAAPSTVMPSTKAPVTIAPATTIPAAIEPAKQVKPYAMSTDTQTYPSARSAHPGVSDYRFEVAKEKARARRLRMEVKKWYGIDSARPTTYPTVHAPIYSAYYNGVFSRPNYYNNSVAPFYFYQSVNR